MLRLYRLLTTLLVLAFTASAFGQTEIIRKEFAWEETPTRYLIGDETIERWTFAGANFGGGIATHPYWVYRFPVNGYGDLAVEVTNVAAAPLEKTYVPEDEALGPEVRITTSIVREPEGYFAKVACVPIVREGRVFQKVNSFVLNVTHTPRATVRGGPPTNSVLSDGNVYKIAIAETGVYRLSYDFLKNELGISDLDAIDPRTLRVYGNGGGLVPYDVNVERPDDLVENAVEIVGESDGSFDSGDYILLYAEGPDKWRYQADEDRYEREKNIYDARNYYFIKTGTSGNGLRIEEQASVTDTEGTTTTYDGLFRYEEDRVNALHEIEATGTGTGQHWYGDFFKFAREKNYAALFALKGLQTEEAIVIRAKMALRAAASSRFFLDIDGTTLSSELATSVPIGADGEEHHNLAPNAELVGTINTTEENLNVLLRYPHPGGAEQSSGWLDYIQARARLALRMEDDQLLFRDARSRNQASTTFVLGNATGVTIWDVSDPLRVVAQPTTTDGNSLRFGTVTEGKLKEFIAFRENGTFLTPEAVGLIDHQNLHALESQEMLVVYHPDFAEQALQLAEHRRNFSGLRVAAVTTGQVYNEFSSGRVSPTAIRDFAKMIFEREGELRYLLLVGDGSFDCRDLYGFGANFVPVYERDENHELWGYPADDYFAIFNSEPGSDPLAYGVSIAVGRLPVKTVAEAAAVVDKIIQYDTDPTHFGNWRTRMTFLGDDEDTSGHSDDSNDAAELVLGLEPQFNVEKLFFDLFPQESTPAGDRYPVVEEALDRAVTRGSVVTTYLGHGGPRGWAQERVLDIPQIQNWENGDRLGIFLTATCTFGDYDNSAFVSAGEELLLNPRGGAVALLTTTRPVFAGRNAALTNKSLTEMLRQDEQGRWTTLGDVIRIAKNSLSDPSRYDRFSNERKFMLMGDPAMRPALPRFKVRTTAINGIAVAENNQDTLSALETVTISGRIEDLDGSPLSDFNGTVFPTVYDKRVDARTLVNDPGSRERVYAVRKNVLFRGQATVENGAFNFSFVVPKDINYEFGPGKISYYAADPDRRIDAGGSEERFIIGGSNPDGVEDDTPPVVEVFMNSADFVAGSQVSPDPTLVVKLSDDFGINVTGNSIGHDLEGFLNENTQNSYLLNDFYESATDDYTKGEVRFPLKDLAPGTYTMRVRAWDVANNLGEGSTEFIVADDGKIALQNVLNYPNPFTDRTCFQFDTNIAGEDLEVLIQIFTVSGRLVKTIDQLIPANDGALRQDDCIEWDGKDDYGDQLARGVYLYQVRVRSQSGRELRGESEFEKLVILK